MATKNAEYEEFKLVLRDILKKILVEVPYNKISSDRTDFRATEYRLPDYNIGFRNMQLFFNGLTQGIHLADVDQQIYQAQYRLTLKVRGLGKIQIGTLARRPKASLLFFRRPYQSSEAFMYGSLERIAKEVCPHILIEFDGKKN